MEREQHHDLLIQQLRAEIYELKKSEEDYYLLQQQLNRLETKYRLLSEQKLSNDKEHNSKHDSYTKLILETKHELTVLEDQLKYKQTDLKEIETQGITLKRLCEEKNTEIERLRLERNALIAEDEELKLEDERIDHQMSRMHSEINGLKGEYERAQNEAQHSLDKNRQYEKYLSELNNEAKTFLEDIRNLQDRIANTERQFESKGDHVKGIEKQISDASSASKELEIDIAEVTSQNEKYKGEITHYIRLGQSEIHRANQIIKSIQVLENSLKMIHEENLEVAEEIKELETENAQISDINIKLDLDNENCQKHIEILATQNQYLMQELDKLADQDQVVRGLLMRRKGIPSRVKQGSVKLSRTSHQSRF